MVRQYENSLAVHTCSDSKLVSGQYSTAQANHSGGGAIPLTTRADTAQIIEWNSSRYWSEVVAGSMISCLRIFHAPPA